MAQSVSGVCEMEKFINEEGKVGVLVSNGYGAGWSTWVVSDDPSFYAMDKTLIEMKQRGASSDEVEQYCEKAKGESPYMGGWSDTEIEWLDPGTVFTIHEYDGYESLQLIEDLAMTA